MMKKSLKKIKNKSLKVLFITHHSSLIVHNFAAPGP